MAGNTIIMAKGRGVICIRFAAHPGGAARPGSILGNLPIDKRRGMLKYQHG